MPDLDYDTLGLATLRTAASVGQDDSFIWLGRSQGRFPPLAQGGGSTFWAFYGWVQPAPNLEEQRVCCAGAF
jgi:hypothetical protein